MGNPKGFLNFKRESGHCRPVCERTKDFLEVAIRRSDEKSEEQASRCMDCGTPFCHWGCPVGNYIPEWNDAAHSGNWEKAFELLSLTNPLPEITGRLCPAPCEYACVLGINDDPVTIRENELDIIEYAYKNGLIKPTPPRNRSGKKAAVIGSGPAGLSCAAELNRLGHTVFVFEKDEKIGGIMRFGIPDFKLDKKILDRRINLWEKEGIEFRCGVNPVKENLEEFDAVCIAIGSRCPRDLKIPGRELDGIHFAMDYLVQANRNQNNSVINTRGKKVVVIGGGDTGSDCVGTAIRQGASCVVQIEILPKPPGCRARGEPWPTYPNLFKTSSSHEEGAERKWEIETIKFKAKGEGRGKTEVGSLICSKTNFKEKFEIEADLVILAMGFLRPEHDGLLDELKVEYDRRGNIKSTPNPRIFAAGDCRRGQSLIVWAIQEGLVAARSMNEFLKVKK